MGAAATRTEIQRVQGARRAKAVPSDIQRGRASRATRPRVATAKRKVIVFKPRRRADAQIRVGVAAVVRAGTLVMIKAAAKVRARGR